MARVSRPRPRRRRRVRRSRCARHADRSVCPQPRPHLPYPVRSRFEGGRRLARCRSSFDLRGAAGRRGRRRRRRSARVEQRRDEGAAREPAAVRSTGRWRDYDFLARESRHTSLNALQFVPPPVPGPPDGRAGLGCSSASVLGSLRFRSSECGGFVPGNADGSLVLRVGPTQAIALTAAPLGGTSVAAPSRRTMTIREPQWPRDFLDRRLRTMKGIANRRRSIPMTVGLRRRTIPRPRNTVVTPIA